MPNLRYYAAQKDMPQADALRATSSEFLRTGRIDRQKTQWHEGAKRYLSYEDVARQTGKRLETAGIATHERINAFHASIRFPKLVFHRTLAGRPHLGYCHITSSRSKFSEFDTVRWSFYIANFFSEIGDDEHFFDKINLGYSRMYFAVATEKDAETGKLNVNRTVRGDGLLFRTSDSKKALQNVLMLGARNDALRDIIRNL